MLTYDPCVISSDSPPQPHSRAESCVKALTEVIFCPTACSCNLTLPLTDGDRTSCSLVSVCFTRFGIIVPRAVIHSESLYTQAKQCTDIQTSGNYFHTLHVEGLFTVLPPFNMQSVFNVHYSSRRTREKRALRVQKVPICQYYVGVKQCRYRGQNTGLVQHAVTRVLGISVQSAGSLPSIQTNS